MASSARKAWMIPLGIAGGAAALGAAGWIALRGAAEAEPSRAPTALRSSEPAVPKGQLKQATEGVRSLSPSEQLRLAFATVFGNAASATRTIGDETYTYTPAALEWIGDKAALLSFGRNAQDCHACFGKISVHYLTPEGGRFEVSGAWMNVIEGAPWGEATNGLSVRRDFSSFPVVQSKFGDMAQGCMFSGVSLTELRADGPSQWDDVRTGYSSDAFGEEEQTTNLSGKIGDIQKDRSFKVFYTGEDRFTETYVRRGRKFALTAEESRIPVC